MYLLCVFAINVMINTFTAHAETIMSSLRKLDADEGVVGEIGRMESSRSDIECLAKWAYFIFQLDE